MEGITYQHSMRTIMAGTVTLLSVAGASTVPSQSQDPPMQEVPLVDYRAQRQSGERLVIPCRPGGQPIGHVLISEPITGFADSSAGVRAVGYSLVSCGEGNDASLAAIRVVPMGSRDPIRASVKVSKPDALGTAAASNGIEF